MIPAASLTYHDDKGGKILWKISTFLPDYEVLEPRRGLSLFTSIFRTLRTDHKNKIYCRHSNTFSLFAQAYSSWDMKLTSNFHLLPQLKMSGATPPLHQIPSWQSQGPRYLYQCNHHPSPRLRMCGATPHSCMAGCLIMQRDKFALPTTSLEKSPSSEVNSSLASHNIPHILWNPHVHY